MEWRRLLANVSAGLAAAAAGCIGRIPLAWGPSAPRSVSLSEVDAVGTAHSFELRVELATRGLRHTNA